MNNNSIKKTFSSSHHQLFKDILICISPFIAIIICKLFKITNEKDIQILMRSALCILVSYGVYSHCKGTLTSAKVVTLVVLAGCVIRIGYIAYTPVATRAHDMGGMDSNGTGHYGYLWHMMNACLPSNNQEQFYQPPFYYLITAVFIKITTWVTCNSNWNDFLYMGQVVSCISSVTALLFSVKLMDELNINKKFQPFGVMLIAFYPVQILASGRLNNDSMVLMFMILSLYFTIRWHKTQNIYHIIGIAVAIGLGMMTKINCAIMAFVAGPVMIYHLAKVLKTKDRNKLKGIMIQFTVFAVICFPLGLWYGIRNMILFDQPFNYVYRIAENVFVFRGDTPWFERWGTFSITTFKQNPYMNVHSDSNIWATLVRTGVHGEFDYVNMSGMLSWMIEYAHLLVLLITTGAVVFTVATCKELDKISRYIPACIGLLVFVLYIQFNQSYKYICTADFRYILLSQIAGAVCIIFMMEHFYRNKDQIMYRYLFKGFTVVIGIFCMMGIMHWC